MNYYDQDAYAFNVMTIRRAFMFLSQIPAPNTPNLMIKEIRSSGNKDKLGQVSSTDRNWSPRTLEVFGDFTLPHNDNELISNIVVAKTGTMLIPARSDKAGTNQALVNGLYKAHRENPSNLGWTIAHETGHILLGFGADNDPIWDEKGIMTQGAWDTTTFNSDNQDKILKRLKK